MDSTKRGPVEGFRCACVGLWHTLRTQWAAPIHLSAAINVVVVGVVLRLNAAEWAVILLVTGLVFVAEMLNTVIEAIVDLIVEQHHPLAKRAKDVAAGAVLATAITSVAVGLLILGPPLLARLGWTP